MPREFESLEDRCWVQKWVESRLQFLKSGAWIRMALLTWTWVHAAEIRVWKCRQLVLLCVQPPQYIAA